MLRLFRVEGISMVPSLLPNDIVLTRNRKIQKNDLIIFRSQIGLMVKRIKKIEVGLVEVVGDNLNVRDLTRVTIIDPKQYEATIILNLSGVIRVLRYGLNRKRWSVFKIKKNTKPLT